MLNLGFCLFQNAGFVKKTTAFLSYVLLALIDRSSALSQRQTTIWSGLKVEVVGILNQQVLHFKTSKPEHNKDVSCIWYIWLPMFWYVLIIYIFIYIYIVCLYIYSIRFSSLLHGVSTNTFYWCGDLKMFFAEVMWILQTSSTWKM